MKFTVWIALCGILIGVIGGVAGLTFYQQTQHSNASIAAGSSPSIPTPRADSVNSGDNMSPEDHAEFDKRQEEASRKIHRAADQFLTGDPEGRAEWVSANGVSVTCGVTPDGRYLLVQNEIGKTRYDERSGDGGSFNQSWQRSGCEVTAPIHQASILAKAAEDRLYNATHPIDADCLMREFREFATKGNAATIRQQAHPHECQGPKEVWQAAMPEPSDQASASNTTGDNQ